MPWTLHFLLITIRSTATSGIYIAGQEGGSRLLWITFQSSCSSMDVFPSRYVCGYQWGYEQAREVMSIAIMRSGLACPQMVDKPLPCPVDLWSACILLCMWGQIKMNPLDTFTAGHVWAESCFQWDWNEIVQGSGLLLSAHIHCLHCLSQSLIILCEPIDSSPHLSSGMTLIRESKVRLSLCSSVKWIKKTYTHPILSTFMVSDWWPLLWCCRPFGLG